MDEVVNHKLKKGDWGIEGYYIPNFNAHFDKPRVPKITKDKRKCFIDEFVKSKSFLPPADYNVTNNLLSKNKKSFLGKGKRITLL